MLLIESGLVIIAIITAVIGPQLGSAWFGHVERGFAALGRRRTLSVIIVGLLALALRAALLPVEPIPEPVVHDEFGYLLIADTFAHGRLTNPTHPLWTHFETFHVIHQPTYAAQYPPVQGLFLAAGQLFIGHPFWGVWLSVGLMCASICWMLQAWLPARWALLGGLLAILRYGAFGYWANSYWGGAAGAIGGALVLGAVPRIKRYQRVRDALLMAGGLAILANTRPYEGLMFAIPIAFALFSWILRRERPLVISFRRVIAPSCMLLLLAGLAMGLYFWRVTGSPLRMPYQVAEKTYGVAPLFVFQSLKPVPAYHHAVMREMYATQEPQMHEFSRSPVGMVIKAAWLWTFYAGITLTLPIILAFFTLPYGFSWKEISPNGRLLLLVIAFSIVGLALETYFAPHYAAPIGPAILTLFLICMRRLRGWKWHRHPTGLFITRAVLCICLASFILRAAAAPLHIHLDEPYAPAWYQLGPHSFGRESIEKGLQELRGKHLVIVRYKPDHDPFAEWVYNRADIDNAKVVWAREMGSPEDASLLTYFKDRQVYLLEADEKPPKLSTYHRDGLGPEPSASVLDPGLQKRPPLNQ